MYQITDSDDERLLSEAESFSAAQLAARTHWAEGEPLPILIWLDEREVSRFVDGQRGPTFQGIQGVAKGLS